MDDDEDFTFGSTLDNGQSTHHLHSAQTDRAISSKKLAHQKKDKDHQKLKHDNKNSKPNKDEGSLMVSPNDYQLSRARHPTVCVASVLFKGSAFVVYFLLGYLLSNVLTFIFTVILSALDFWVVKNVSGRLLVGLRWWSDYDEKGNQIWLFETHGGDFKPNLVDQSFFWTSQIVGTLTWGLFLLLNILQIDALGALLMAINFGFCATNLYGYYKCHGEHNKKIRDLKQQIGKAGLLQLAGRFI